MLVRLFFVGGTGPGAEAVGAYLVLEFLDLRL